MNVPPHQPAPSLSTLHEVELLPPYRGIYEKVALGAGGPEPWRRRKQAAAHELLALAQLSQRITIQYLDLTEAIRTVFALRVPVPCRRGGVGPFQVAPMAVIGLTYRPEAALRPQPGFSFAEILEPRDVFHPNVSPSYQPPGAQILCLGPKLPAGIRMVDLVLMIYTATCLQDATFSFTDSAGLANQAAGLFLEANPARVPLTREPFLSSKEVIQ
ncbi:MAG TPA: hypothetical protein VNU68_04735 [Verrucomicrobiae bacterium]|jgi:hypothetical protein|nr:hypothetical protein [Verrucomicrobiae bacterium]